MQATLEKTTQKKKQIKTIQLQIIAKTPEKNILKT
jgi:hypothetical protein